MTGPEVNYSVKELLDRAREEQQRQIRELATAQRDQHRELKTMLKEGLAGITATVQQHQTEIDELQKAEENRTAVMRFVYRIGGAGAAVITILLGIPAAQWYLHGGG